LDANNPFPSKNPYASRFSLTSRSVECALDDRYAEQMGPMYTTLRDYRFNRDIDDIRGSTVYGSGNEKIGKIDESSLIPTTDESDSLDTGGWLSSRRFLVPPEELRPSPEHDIAG
jgi:hypothetical protein